MLKRVFDNQSDIPTGCESFYTEKDGKWLRNDTMIEGVTSSESVTRLEGTLKKVRDELKIATTKLTAFGDLTPEAALLAISERDELKIKVEAAGGKVDDTKIADLVKGRVLIEMAPRDKKINELTKERDEAVKAAGELRESSKRAKIMQNLSEAAIKAGVLKESVNRVVALNLPLFDMDEAGNIRTKEVEGVVPGLDPAAVINDMKTTDPYFWPASQGGGASGGAGSGVTGPNPWGKANWNMTEQGKVMAKDPKKAEALARQAGVDVHAMGPKPD